MGTFDPDSPSNAKGWELATYVKTQLESMMATSQVNADILTDLYAEIATLDAVIDSVGS
jgi:hypothetical protein